MDKHKKYEITLEQLKVMKEEMRNDLLGELKHELRHNIYEGSECPCCATFVQAREEFITKQMLYSLKSLAELSVANPHKLSHHKDDIMKHFKLKSNVQGKLRYWGLVSTDNCPSGYYKMTEKGYDFLMNKISIPQSVWIFRDRKIKPPNDTKAKKLNYKAFKVKLKMK